MRISILLASALGAGLFLGACGGEGQTPDVSANRVSEETREAYEAAREYSFQKRLEYQRALEGYLTEVDQRIDSLSRSAARTADSAATAVNQELDVLRRERDKAAAKLEELGSATAENWKDAKASLERSIEELERSLDRIGRRIG